MALFSSNYSPYNWLISSISKFLQDYLSYWLNCANIKLSYAIIDELIEVLLVLVPILERVRFYNYCLKLVLFDIWFINKWPLSIQSFKFICYSWDFKLWSFIGIFYFVYGFVKFIYSYMISLGLYALCKLYDNTCDYLILLFILIGLLD